MPERETLAAFAATGATLAIHLSINNLASVVRELAPACGADCPVVVVHRASWPDQRIVRGTLASIRGQIKGLGITRTALILVGRALAAEGFEDSRLYAADHHHVLRPRREESVIAIGRTVPPRRHPHPALPRRGREEAFLTSGPARRGLRRPWRRAGPGAAAGGAA